MKRAVLAALAVLMIAAAGVADMGRGGGPEGMMGPGDHGPGGPGGPGGHAIVGPDGTIYLMSGMTTNGTTTVAIKAIRSTGTTAWTATLPDRAHGLVLSGTNLIAQSDVRNSDGTFTATLTAISTVSGSTAWTKTISGRVVELVPFNGGTYAFVVVPATTSGGTAARSLVAIGNDGSTLWTVAL